MHRFARSLSLASLSFVAAVTALGCSASTSTGTSTAEIESSCTDMAQARCARFASCSSTLIQTRYGDAATCMAQLKETCVNALNAPANGNNPTHEEACAQALPTWACAAYLDDT